MKLKRPMYVLRAVAWNGPALMRTVRKAPLDTDELPPGRKNPSNFGLANDFRKTVKVELGRLLSLRLKLLSRRLVKGNTR
jgi:hypothetical protein